jgi:hypothetical protein
MPARAAPTTPWTAPGISRIVTDELADMADAATLAATRADAERVAAETGQAAAAWGILAEALAEAWESRNYVERSRAEQIRELNGASSV